MKKLISILTMTIVTMVSPIVASTTPTCSGNTKIIDKDKGYEPIQFSQQATTTTLYKTLRFKNNQQDCVDKLTITLNEIEAFSKNDNEFMNRMCKEWLSKNKTKIDITFKVTKDPINKMTMKELDYL